MKGASRLVVLGLPRFTGTGHCKTTLALPALFDGRVQGDLFMSSTLTQKTCTPCRGGVPALTRAEAQRYGAQTPEWALVDDARRIERTFRFPTFRQALTFVQKVGELAEAEGHHPDISFGWGYATVSLRTKKIAGLHENDFILAAKIDLLATQPNRPVTGS